MMTFVPFGEHDEHKIVVQRIVRLEGLAEQVAGHVKLKDGQPNFTATLIAFEDTTSVVVPGSPEQVLARIVEAASPPSR